MTIPILSPVIDFIGKKVLWRILRFTVFRLAKTFVGKYRPDVHAKMSRGWEWKNAWRPMIEKATKTPNPLDDPIVRFVYYHQACYIDDGSLSSILRQAEGSQNIEEARQHIQLALKMIELSPDDSIVKK